MKTKTGVSTLYGQKQELSNQWLDTKQVAKLIGVTTRTIQNYRDQGMLPFSQIGRVIRYRAQDVQDFLMEFYVSPGKREGGDT